MIAALPASFGRSSGSRPLPVESRSKNREIAGTAPNEALLWVGQARPLRIDAEINEEDIVKVRPRQRVLLRHDGHEGTPLEAVVERLTPKGDPETKTFRAYLLLPDDTPLMIGMSVEANIVVREVEGVEYSDQSSIPIVRQCSTFKELVTSAYWVKWYTSLLK